jgi:prolipoprotein diacylglyceryltransferase
MRHDLGLYESIFSFFIFIIFALLFKKLVKIGWGLVTGFSFGLYAVGRFFLDFLRATDLDYSDAKYFYLTPAQWGMLVIMLTLTFWVIFAKIKRVKNS